MEIKILTCIDNLSRYVFARPLKLKTAIDVRDGMESICEEAGAYPSLIQRYLPGVYAAATPYQVGELKIIFTRIDLIENFNNQLNKKVARSNDTK
jgi:hypothetical protein